jgi:hypothetical protein
LKNLPKLICITFFVLSGYNRVWAQGDLMVFPKRMVFTDDQRSQEFTLVNTGKDTATYNMSLINFRMTETGQFENVSQPDSGQHFADQNLRIFPRAVTLAPRESQKVKVQVYRATQLEEGEYRSHLSFQGVKEQKPLEKKVVEEKAEGITTQINIDLGVTVPVILLVGDPPATAGFSQVILDTEDQNVPQLDFIVHRKGNKSLYGDIKLIHTAPSGQETEVGTFKGVAVYAPIPQRHFSITLPTEKVDYSSGKLSLSYQVPEKSEKLAATELVLK